jgi:dipeptidyl aminopeptidase/acylaminoacyl peptidase
MQDIVGLLAVCTAGATLGYAAICGAVAHHFTRARRRPPAEDDVREMQQHHVRFPARDRRAQIDAWYLPAKPRTAAVILVHGKDSCRGDALKGSTVALARQLAAHGLSVLMIDLRGHGASSRARLTYGVREREDVLGAVDYLLDRGYSPGAIGVLGASMGGVAALHAAVGDEAIGAVIADSAFADFGEMIERAFTGFGHLPRLFLPGALAFGRALTGVDLRRLCPVEQVRQLDGRPVLIVHGEHDPFIPVEHAHRLATASRGALWVTDSRSHIGSMRDDPGGYAARVVEFFWRHLDQEPALALRSGSPDQLLPSAAGWSRCA